MRASARNPDDAVLGIELTGLAGDVADVWVIGGRDLLLMGVTV